MKNKIFITIVVSMFLINFSCKSKKTRNKKENLVSKTAKEPKESEKLVTNYTVIKINDKEVTIKSKPTMDLDFEKNTISGTSSCNSYSGSIKVDTDVFNVGMIRSTKRYCNEMENVESTFYKALSMISRHSIEGNHILFYNKSGNLILVAKENN